jgi:hypothetical protein
MDPYHLDYFQIYEVTNHNNFAIRPTAGLKCQFDDERKEFQLIFLRWFGDRTAKNKEGLVDDLAHLTWYMLGLIEIVNIHVQVANQFFPDGQNFLIHEVVGLLVPAQKKLPGQRRFSFQSPELDHFKVYKIQPIDQDKPSRTFDLKDQFGPHTGVRLFEPAYFAVPVKKFRSSEVRPTLHHEGAHLVIYRVDSTTIVPPPISIKDQFRTIDGVSLGVSNLLAVPSQKLGWRKI